MGYLTNYNGLIKFSNDKSYDFAKKCFKKEDNYSLYESSFNDETNSIQIYEEWKDYDDIMLSICSMALYLDKDIDIDIDCDGDDSDDKWNIGVKNSKIIVNQGRIIYDQEVDFNEDKIKSEEYLQRLYDITKDENLLKELMLNKMESEK
jgi:hypothetical protein